MDKYDELLNRMLEAKSFRDTYDECIVKDITFKEWVQGTLDDILIWRIRKCQQ